MRKTLNTVSYCKQCTADDIEQPTLLEHCHVQGHYEIFFAYLCVDCYEVCATAAEAYRHCMWETPELFKEFVCFLSPPNGWLQHCHCPKCGQRYGLETNGDLYRCYDCKSLVSEEAIIINLYRRKIDPLQVRNEYLHFKRKQESIHHTFVF